MRRQPGGGGAAAAAGSAVGAGDVAAAAGFTQLYITQEARLASSWSKVVEGVRSGSSTESDRAWVEYELVQACMDNEMRMKAMQKKQQLERRRRRQQQRAPRPKDAAAE
jgi:hypothetical protein